MKKFILLLLVPIMLYPIGKINKNCTFNGKHLSGRVKVVDNGTEDFKVQIVSNGVEDLKVQLFSYSRNECGAWNYVDNGTEDFKIRFVTNGTQDFQIQIVANGTYGVQ